MMVELSTVLPHPAVPYNQRKEFDVVDHVKKSESLRNQLPVVAWCLLRWLT